MSHLVVIFYIKGKSNQKMMMMMMSSGSLSSSSNITIRISFIEDDNESPENKKLSLTTPSPCGGEDGHVRKENKNMFLKMDGVVRCQWGRWVLGSVGEWDS